MIRSQLHTTADVSIGVELCGEIIEKMEYFNLVSEHEIEAVNSKNIWNDNSYD